MLDRISAVIAVALAILALSGFPATATENGTASLKPVAEVQREIGRVVASIVRVPEGGGTEPVLEQIEQLEAAAKGSRRTLILQLALYLRDAQGTENSMAAAMLLKHLDFSSREIEEAVTPYLETDDLKLRRVLDELRVEYGASGPGEQSSSLVEGADGTERSACLPDSVLPERPMAQWRMPGFMPLPATGKLLVARDGMRDPNFSETVVLLISYDAAGALGLVLNRKSEVALGEILPGVERLKERDDPVFLGGPVNRNRVFLLVRSAEPLDLTRPVLDGVHVGENAKLLDRLIEEGSDTEFRAFAGYAGWAAGQLEAEIEAGGWHVVAGSEERVFSDRPSTLWRSLLPRNELEWSRLMPRAGER